MKRSFWGALLAALGLVIVGCAPAGPYQAKPATKPGAPTKAEEPARPAPRPVDLGWMSPDPEEIKRDDIPIAFVHEETSPAEWNRLQAFWTLEETPPRPEQAASILGLKPFIQGGLAAAAPPRRVVKIKVPSGLDAVGPEQVPASNPPTVSKWELGKRLFFDDGYLQPEDEMPRVSCATCHDPSRGFTDGHIRRLDWAANTPTLINVRYGQRFFWDGRASSLEEVVQRVRADDRDGDGGPNRHVWSGVVRRLRGRADYDQRFREVFGTPPTQDAFGKALATYLRTILSGGSLHDRAERARKERGGKSLEPADYEKVLTESAVRAVMFDPAEPGELAKKEVAAERLHAGYTLFHGKGRCIRCHSGGNYTDNHFHNLGIDTEGRVRFEVGQEPGRFATLPVGRKDWNMVAAYKTPTLRGLLASGPYFHDGSATLGSASEQLFWAVMLHVRGSVRENPYLDPELRDPGNPLHHRDFGLKEDELRALVMFLRALDGEPADPVVADPARRPDETKPSRRD